MTFGRNPHEAKALAAEQKAVDATDDIARTAAYREAAHQWDRAAGKEKPGKRRVEYEANAERNRQLADGNGASPAAEEPAARPAAPPKGSRNLN
jgi:hypothetical protein